MVYLLSSTISYFIYYHLSTIYKISNHRDVSSSWLLYFFTLALFRWNGLGSCTSAWKLPLDQLQPPMSYAGIGPCPNDFMGCVLSLWFMRICMAANWPTDTYGSFQLLSVPRLNICMQICQSRNEFQSWSMEDHIRSQVSFNIFQHMHPPAGHFRPLPLQP